MTRYENIKNMSIEEMAEYHTRLIYDRINALIERLGLSSYEPTEKDFKESMEEWKELLESECETE